MISTLGRTANRLVEAAAVLLLLAMLASVFLGVIFRFLNAPLAWTDEMAQYLLVWTAFTGWIIAGNRGSHIRIIMFLDALKGRPRLAAEIVIQLLVAILGLVLLTKSFGLIARNSDVEWVSLPLPVALVYLPIPIAGLAVVIRCGVEILAALRGELHKPHDGLPL